jgi:hypothetical protein
MARAGLGAGGSERRAGRRLRADRGLIPESAQRTSVHRVLAARTGRMRARRSRVGRGYCRLWHSRTMVQERRDEVRLRTRARTRSPDGTPTRATLTLSNLTLPGMRSVTTNGVVPRRAARGRHRRRDDHPQSARLRLGRRPLGHGPPPSYSTRGLDTLAAKYQQPRSAARTTGRASAGERLVQLRQGLRIDRIGLLNPHSGAVSLLSEPGLVGEEAPHRVVLIVAQAL